MGVFGRNKKAVGYYLIIAAYLCILLCSGCTWKDEVKGDDVQGQEETEAVWKPSYELTEDTLLSWDFVHEVETDNYRIEGGFLPEFSLKEGEGTLCGEEFLRDMIDREIYNRSYQIMYADEYYLCILWNYSNYNYFYHVEDAKESHTIIEPYILTICLQNPVYEVGNEGEGEGRTPHLYNIQEDLDYPNGFWPGNGIDLSLEKILQEIEGGNCYMDRAGYKIYQESPGQFIESIREQFKQIEETGFAQSYSLRFWSSGTPTALKMYIREGRVGFFIRLKDRGEDWEEYPLPMDFDYDFRIEVEYDWKQDTPVYQMPYEVYSLSYKSENCGEVFYPQIKGIEAETEEKINQLMKENVEKNVSKVNLEEINERVNDAWDWEEAPQIGPPRILFRTERYLCIRQEPLISEDETLRYIEEWQRDYVYDLKTGECLRLGDVIELDEEFVDWLKKPETLEKVETGLWWQEGHVSLENNSNLAPEMLRDYPDDYLLETLKDSEFYLKEGQLFIRLGRYNFQYGGRLYRSGGTSGRPRRIEYISCRISVEDLGDFLIVEPW